jgi:hypothetical protein
MKNGDFMYVIAGLPVSKYPIAPDDLPFAKKHLCQHCLAYFWMGQKKQELLDHLQKNKEYITFYGCFDCLLEKSENLFKGTSKICHINL